MRVAFYKSSVGGISDKVVAWWTSPFSDKFNGEWKTGYSHVEFVFHDGLMFSASPVAGKCRFAEFSGSSSWDVVTINMEPLVEDTVRSFCKNLEGLKYDYLGILGFVFGNPDSGDRWFCSEVVSAGLKIVGELPYEVTPSTISPNKLYNLLEED